MGQQLTGNGRACQSVISALTPYVDSLQSASNAKIRQMLSDLSLEPISSQCVSETLLMHMQSAPKLTCCEAGKGLQYPQLRWCAESPC